MTGRSVKVLLVADTHLGFDFPFRPRILRRRRGHEFFANFERALEPAMRGEVDLVVHGGDLFYRSKVPTALVDMAMEPLLRVAEKEVPVFLVPGNHERSRIPLHLWSAHPHLHIFDGPKTFLHQFNDVSIALSGFPFERKIRDSFIGLVAATEHQKIQADIRLLCFHQTVEGAQVGVINYTFRTGPDVIRGRDIPEVFCAVLSGHIHRAQILREELRGHPLTTPVIYPGSIERTSFAERKEDKGYAILELAQEPGTPGKLVEADFVTLPARPMVSFALEGETLLSENLEETIQDLLKVLDPNAVVRIQVPDDLPPNARAVLSAANLRRLAPKSMNVAISYPRKANPRSQNRDHADPKVSMK